VALLPTPGKADGDGGHLNSEGFQSTLPGVARDIALLPSPRTSDTNGAGHHGDGGMDLRTAVAEIPLLPTPAVNDMGAAYTPETWDEWTATMKAKHNNGNGHGKSLNVETQRLLPTPTARDPKGENIRGDDSCLTGALLPTPTATDSKSSGSAGYTTGHDGTTLTDATVRQPDRWGEYGPAIRRWESLTRPAPAPTKLNAKGNPKLSDLFDEWLMGLPAGWITDVPGITWNEVLKACGNGVVPQQAEAAIRWLLARIEAVA
jgi:DNA (cytosine-5)-methyltransferase 1